MTFFLKLALEDLPKIQIRIGTSKYVALIDTGVSLSIIDEKINDFKKIAIKPIHFTIITGRDTIHFEVHTHAPKEL